MGLCWARAPYGELSSSPTKGVVREGPRAQKCVGPGGKCLPPVDRSSSLLLKVQTGTPGLAPDLPSQHLHFNRLSRQLSDTGLEPCPHPVLGSSGHLFTVAPHSNGSQTSLCLRIPWAACKTCRWPLHFSFKRNEGSSGMCILNMGLGHSAAGGLSTTP